MSARTLSVVMATSNGERFLPDQLRSLAQQALLPDELVVVDDASDDSTPSLLKSFARHAPFPVHVQLLTVRGGSTAAFEQAMRGSSGDVIAFCDQDDRWLPMKLARLVAAFNRHPSVALAFSDANLIDAQGNRLRGTLWKRFNVDQGKRRALESDPFAVLVQGPVVTGMTMAVRRSCLNGVFPIPLTWHHDAWISLVLSLRSTFAALPEPLAEYRLHLAQQTYPGPRPALSSTSPDEKARRIAAASQRWLVLSDRVSTFHLGSDPLSASRTLARRAEYLRLRALAYERGARLQGVWRTHRSGGYAEFGEGGRTLLVDLLHLARPHVVAY